MWTSLLKDTITSAIRREGKKQINLDSNNTGSDDAKGHAYVAIAEAVDAVDLGTVDKSTFKNMAAAFRAAADELDKAGETVP